MDPSQARKLWRLAAWLGVIESALAGLCLTMFLAGGGMFSEYSGISASSLPWYQRLALYLVHNPIVVTLLVPLALPLVARASFRLASGRRSGRLIVVTLLGSVLAAGVGPTAAVVVSSMSPFLDDRNTKITYSSDLWKPQALFGCIALGLIALPLVSGYALVKFNSLGARLNGRSCALSASAEPNVADGQEQGRQGEAEALGPGD